MADEYADLAEGIPIWLEVFATDLNRARSFYSTVFKWKFEHEQDLATSETVSFTFPGKVHGLFGGSITKADESERKKRAKSVKTYLFVRDLKKTMEAIVANGGKQVSDIEPEGEHALIMRFEDSEGNLMGLSAPKN